MKKFIVLCLISLLSGVYVGIPSGHHCPYKDCPFKGEKTFTHGCGECEEDSDCWKLDSIHFVHPYWDYDKCDSILEIMELRETYEKKI